MGTRISVVIPTYQRPEFLERAILSILQDDPQAIDIIVIDDDPSASAARIARLFPRVRYFAKRGINQGLAHSRNIGVMLAESPYILFLDDDDYLEPGGISTMLMHSTTGASFYHGNFNYIYRTEKVFRDTSSVSKNKLLVVNQLPIGSYMINKSSMRALFDVNMKSHEDWNFLLDNVDWNDACHIPEHIVNIDKTRDDNSSMQVRRQPYFWMEFLGIYAKHPDPKLSTARAVQLATMGVKVEPAMIG